MPILLETAYLSSQRFPGLEDDPDLEDGSLYDCLSAHYGVIIARVDNSLKAVLLDERPGSAVELAAGSPVDL